MSGDFDGRSTALLREKRVESDPSALHLGG